MRRTAGAMWAKRGAFVLVGLFPLAALAQVAGQPQPQAPAGQTPPTVPGASPGAIMPSQIVGVPGTPSIKAMQGNKTEFLKAQLDAFRNALNLQGAQKDAFTGFEKAVMASVPSSVKFVRDFCADPTPREGRGSFGAAAKRIHVIVDLLKARETDLMSLDKAAMDLRQSVANDADQVKVYNTNMPNLITVVTTVPFGVPDTGLPINCGLIDGIPAGDTKFAPPPGLLPPEGGFPQR